MTSPTAASTAVFYDGRSAEMIAAIVEPTGALCTLEFHETNADSGVAELFRGVEWEKRVPPGTGLLIAQSGHLLAKVDEFWWLWRDGSLLYAQCVHSALVVAVVLEAGERLVERPVIAADGELHIYAWRGAKLVRHRLAGGRVWLEEVWEAPVAPQRSVCAPVPGGDGVLVASVTETGDVLTATALMIRGGKVVDVTGATEGRYRLMTRGRLGLHVGMKQHPALGIMAESRDDDFYALLEAQFDMAKSECIWRRTRMEFITVGSLQSAGVFFYKAQNLSEAFIVAVNAAGDLVWVRKRIVELLRAGVGSNYTYPILTTMTNRYEAVGEGRGITLQRF